MQQLHYRGGGLLHNKARVSEDRRQRNAPNTGPDLLLTCVFFYFRELSTSVVMVATRSAVTLFEQQLIDVAHPAITASLNNQRVQCVRRTYAASVNEPFYSTANSCEISLVHIGRISWCYGE